MYPSVAEFGSVEFGGGLWPESHATTFGVPVWQPSVVAEFSSLSRVVRTSVASKFRGRVWWLGPPRELAVTPMWTECVSVKVFVGRISKSYNRTTAHEGTSHFARVVKGVDLRSTAGNCAWVRTPQVTFMNMRTTAPCSRGQRAFAMVLNGAMGARGMRGPSRQQALLATGLLTRPPCMRITARQ